MKGKTSVVKICKRFWKEIPVFEYFGRKYRYLSILEVFVEEIGED